MKMLDATQRISNEVKSASIGDCCERHRPRRVDPTEYRPLVMNGDWLWRGWFLPSQPTKIAYQLSRSPRLAIYLHHIDKHFTQHHRFVWAFININMTVKASNRLPLEDTTNSPPPSPPATVRSSSQSLRRKRTKRTLNPNIDSSESIPSTHDSLYDASLENDPNAIAPITSDWNNLPSEIGTGVGGAAPWVDTVCDADGNPVPSSFLQPISASRKDHTPHELYPITEHNSLATLRSRFSVSSNATLRARARSPALSTRHKRSFSLSDLPTPIEPQHSSSDSSAAPPFPLPQPNRPIHLPPQRSPTPPDLPSFGKPEALDYRLPPLPKPKRFRDRLGTPTLEELEWRRQTVGLPKGVVMRGEDGLLVRGKFSGIRSGHLPPQRQRHATMGLPSPAPRLVGAWQDRPITTGATTSGPNVQRLERGSQVEESRRITSEVAARAEAERKERRAKRQMTFMRILSCCCPLDVDGDKNGMGIRSVRTNRGVESPGISPVTTNSR